MKFINLVLKQAQTQKYIKGFNLGHKKKCGISNKIEFSTLKYLFYFFFLTNVYWLRVRLALGCG